MTDVLIIVFSSLFTGILLEFLYWRKARKEGKKDLIDILIAKLKKK
jgi:hypothetical protein